MKKKIVTFLNISRIWWMVSFLLSVILCALSISTIWQKWQDQPVTVSFNDRATSISVIPFPAISICTTNKFIKDTIDPALFIETLSAMDTNKTAYKRLTPEKYVPQAMTCELQV